MIHHEKKQQKLLLTFFCSLSDFCTKGVKVLKMWFCRRWEIFFHLISSDASKVIPVLRIKLVKMITDLLILLCPAHCCVQHNIVSTLSQRFFWSPFTFQHAVVLSWCAFKAPQLKSLIHNETVLPCWQAIWSSLQLTVKLIFVVVTDYPSKQPNMSVWTPWKMFE